MEGIFFFDSDIFSILHYNDWIGFHRIVNTNGSQARRGFGYETELDEENDYRDDGMHESGLFGADECAGVVFRAPDHQRNIL